MRLLATQFHSLQSFDSCLVLKTFYPYTHCQVSKAVDLTYARALSFSEKKMDLLSGLPEDVRVHVLSFLTTKEAALTSVLSKKWRNLFALVPSLDVDDSVFLHPEEGNVTLTLRIMHSFMDFVDRVLALQGDSPIKRFSIKCQTGVCPHAVNRWICNVLARGVSELDLCLDFEEEYYLPRELFVSSTLVKLKVRSVFDFDVSWWIGSEGTFLPMLKCLDIGWVCDSKIETLLPCFPVLEDLHMTLRQWIDSHVTVSSATLRKLCISAGGSNPFQNPKSISFDTPNLVSFRYSDYVAEDYSVVDMKNLVEARIAFMVTDDQIKRVRAPDNDLLGNDVVLRFGNLVKLMNGIQNVQKLRLHSDTLEVLYLCSESMPVFNNVKMLCIKSLEDRGWQAMPVLLRNCPNLKVIIFQGLVHHVTDKCGDACDCIYRKDKGRSLASSPVEMIKIEDFTGTMKEMNMIEHFLDYFPRLKKMIIYTEEDGDSELNYNPELAERVMVMIEELNEMYSCEVELLVSENMHKNWRILGIHF